MTPVDQTIFAPEKYDGKTFGNCIAACIASITGIHLSSIPHTPYMADKVTWLDNKGWILEWDCAGSGFCIITGVSPREQIGLDGEKHPLFHAVVGHDGMMIFDPHPSREGLALDENAIPRVDKIFWLYQNRFRSLWLKSRG